MASRPEAEKNAAAAPAAGVKRFYRTAEAKEGAILLDGRPAKTPKGRALTLPSPLLAAAVATEWDEQGDRIDPRTMPLTGLANAAIDRVSPDPASFAGSLAAYGEHDLLCYRAGEPAALADRQAELWDPYLAWAMQTHGLVFEVSTGITPQKQPQETLDGLARLIAAREPFALAGLSPLVTISGSIALALAVAEGASDVRRAWAAASLDEAWQAENWGEDKEATAALEARRRDFEAAARFLALL